MYLSTSFVKKFWSNHQENLENNAKVTFEKKSLSFFRFFVDSSIFYNPFFSIVEKLNISAIYKSIILIVKLFVVFIYKFCQKENLIKPPVELREQHLDEFRQRTSKDPPSPKPFEGTFLYMYIIRIADRRGRVDPPPPTQKN